MKFILSGANFGGMAVTLSEGGDLVGVRDKPTQVIFQYRCGLNPETETAEFVGCLPAETTDAEFAQLGGIMFDPPLTQSGH
jgi:hypothetical protein